MIKIELHTNVDAVDEIDQGWVIVEVYEDCSECGKTDDKAIYQMAIDCKTSYNAEVLARILEKVFAENANEGEVKLEVEDETK